MLFRSKHGNQFIDVFLFAFILLCATVNLGNGNKNITNIENQKELSLPYNNVSAVNSYSRELFRSRFRPRKLFRRKLKKSKRQLVTIEGSGFDIALQAPDLNQTQVEFEFPDDKRNFTVEIVEISHKMESNEDDKPPEYSSAPKRRSKVSRPLYPLDSQSVTTSKPRPVYHKLKPRLKPASFNIDQISTDTAVSNLDVREQDSLRLPQKISSSVRSINDILDPKRRPTKKYRPKPKVVFDDPRTSTFESTSIRSPSVRYKSTTIPTTTEQPDLLGSTKRPLYITRGPTLIFYDDERDVSFDDLKSYLAGYSQFGNKESMTPPPSIYGDDDPVETQKTSDADSQTKISQNRDEGETQRVSQSQNPSSLAVTERTMAVSLSGFLPNYPSHPKPTSPHIKRNADDGPSSKRNTYISTVEKRKRILQHDDDEPERSEVINDSITIGSQNPTRSQNYYTHAQVVPLTKTPESIEKEKLLQQERELEDNSKNFQGNNREETIVIAPNVRYAPQHKMPQKDTRNRGGYEEKGKYQHLPKYDAPSRKYVPPGGKQRGEDISARMKDLYRQGHPGVLPPPKNIEHQSYKQQPYRITADPDFKNPYPHDPLSDEPPLKFDPESDRFYGEPIPDRKESQSNRYEQLPLDRESGKAQNDPGTRRDEEEEPPRERKREDNEYKERRGRVEDDHEPEERKRDDYHDDDRRGRGHEDNRSREDNDDYRPRERKRDDYDEGGRGRPYRPNYFDIPVTAYPITEEERRHTPETDPKGYIQDYVSLDDNFQQLPKVRESDFGSLLPKLSDDEFTPHHERDRYRGSQPARSSSQSRPREDYDYDDRQPEREEYDRDRNRDRDGYIAEREPADTRRRNNDNDHYVEDESQRDLPQDFAGGYQSAGRGFGFGGGEARNPNLPLDPIYTRTLKQFDEEISQLQRNDQGRNKDYPPPVENRLRDNAPLPAPPPPVDIYRPRERERERERDDDERSQKSPKYNQRQQEHVHQREQEQEPPPAKEESAEEPEEHDNSSNNSRKGKEEPPEEEEEEEEEPEQETEAPQNENEKKHEESRQRDTLQEGKDKRPPPEKPQTEKSGNIDEDIIGIEQEWGRDKVRVPNYHS